MSDTEGSCDIQGKLTKAEIVESIGKRLSARSSLLSKSEIHEVIEEFFVEIKNGLVSGRSVELRGFGTFELRHRIGREKARNPRTGDVLKVDSHSVAIFRPGRDLKKRVWSYKLV
ncbi:integration host factor subunit beta [Entomospira entomophila]|uniref:Integration host factor subunit beta n=1 Tax=Entomospira entomophila TaxID=2719988 RepID=A0A968KWE6_9SPIO|nr:HU family DNA-binding protein [Entomospira entomophilus]NIZ40740.1 integration host factor subunit beta [Entomospira entomophilus]WDI34953.1 integration host factor subunit beta [Entomospira entomophilus]